jgi:hypothetical protein
MLEFIAVLIILAVAGFTLVMLTSIFMAYATQANYVDETYDGNDDD